MKNLMMIKFGGSVITDKTKYKTFRPQVAEALLNALSKVDFTLYDVVLGVGAGSFGHQSAMKAMDSGVLPTKLPQLIHIVKNEIAELVSLIDGIGKEKVLFWSRVKIVNGDINLTKSGKLEVKSTEEVFCDYFKDARGDYAEVLVLLLTKAAGVLDEQGRVMPILTRQCCFPSFSKSKDATGQMQSKVAWSRKMGDLGARVFIADGRTPNSLLSFIESQNAGTEVL